MDQAKLLNLLERVLGDSKLHKNEEAAFWCPFCRREAYKKKLTVNLINQKFHCWICDVKGRKISWLFKRLKLSKRYFDELKDIVGDDDDVLSYKEKKEYEYEIIQLPDEFKPLYINSISPERKNALFYLKKRGITMNDIVKYNIGYCEDGKYKKRIIIPSYDESGSLNYFIARKYYDTNNALAYLKPSYTNDIVGFELHTNFDQEVTIVEGPFDAIAIKRNAIPLFGKRISNELLYKLITHQPPKINIALDNDAIQDAVSILEQLLTYDLDVHLILLPENEDPSVLGFEKMNLLIKESRSLSFEDIIKLKLHSI